MVPRASPTSSRASRTRACTSAGRSGGTFLKRTEYPMERSRRAARLDREDRDAPPLRIELVLHEPAVPHLLQERRTREEAALQDEHLLGGLADTGELLVDEPPQPDDP